MRSIVVAGFTSLRARRSLGENPRGRNRAMTRPTVLAALVLLLAVPGATWAAGSPALGDLSKVGTVEFADSCNEQAQPEFVRGMALLHSFFYEEARRVFTYVPTRPQMRDGLLGRRDDLVPPHLGRVDGRRRGLGPRSRREGGVDHDGGRRTEREHYRRRWRRTTGRRRRRPGERSGRAATVRPTTGTRRAAFTKAMEHLHAKYPNDIEAATFYALSRIQSSPTQVNPEATRGGGDPGTDLQGAPQPSITISHCCVSPKRVM